MFMKLTEEEAKGYGISSETYHALKDIFKNDSSPIKLAELLKNNTDQADAIGTMITANTSPLSSLPSLS